MEIALQKASRRIRKTAVLDDVTVSFPPGQITAVIGRNGAGKTSLLRALAGHLVLDSGKLLYGGEEFSRENIEMRRSVMALFEPRRQSKESNGGETPINIVSSITDAYCVDKIVDDESFIEMFTAFELLDDLERPIYRLSRGMQYRVFLCSLFLCGSETLLIDEPFAMGLDAPATTILKNFMRRHVNSGGNLLYTTQLPELVEHFAHRTIVVENGSIIGDMKADAEGSFPNLRDLLENEKSTTDA